MYSGYSFGNLRAATVELGGGRPGNKLLDRSLSDSLNVYAAGACLKRHIVAADSSTCPIEQQAPGIQLEKLGMAQVIGILAVFVASADLIDLLRQQVALEWVE
jgi:hypothetical protein